MKRSTKRDIAISCFVLALGCFLMAAGWGMGGSLATGRNLSIGGANGIYLGPDGIRIGGSHGIVLGPGGISIGGGALETSYIQAIAEPEPTAKIEAQLTNGVTRLEVDIDLGDIKVMHGTGYEVSLSWNVKDYELRYTNEDGCLRIWSEGQNSNHIGFTGLSASAVITLPVSCKLESAMLTTNLGNVFWTAKAAVNDVEVKTNLGNVYWGGKCQAKFVVLESDLGNVEVHGLTAKELRAVSDLGDIRIGIPTSLYGVSYDLSTAMGTVSAYGSKRGEDASYTAVDEKCYIVAKCSMGDIILERERSEE